MPIYLDLGTERVVVKTWQYITQSATQARGFELLVLRVTVNSGYNVIP